jgi:hypothetical protein
MATNLRFGASTDDTNLSGGTLFLGTEPLPFVPPGDNSCVGIYADYENRFVYFALYNSSGNREHGIYRINSFDNSVQAVVAGSWLKFLLTYADGTPFNVSMVSIDGKLYWTDDLNPPRMVNVEKGIRTQLYFAGQGPGVDIYPPAQEWHYTQLKRPPGMALRISPLIENVLQDVSLTKLNRSQTDTGFQYSYYYVYDNYEESRLAPYSINTFANLNVQVIIPADEFIRYVFDNNIVYAIVIVVRNGNDGVWREIKYARNDGSLTITSQGDCLFTFPNIQAASKTLVDSDITDARFDSVPLISKTNEIAQNRVIHGNYLLDYDAVSGIEFECNIISTSLSSFHNLYDKNTERSFMPWGRYSFGVEFVDIYGRTIPVANTADQYSGNWKVGQDVTTLKIVNTYSNVQDTVIDNNDTRYVAYFRIKGNLPLWVDRVNIVRSKSKNIIQMNQSMVFMYLWYRTPDNTDAFFTFVPLGINPQWNPLINPQVGPAQDLNVIFDSGTPDKKYTFMGYALRYNSGEPFVQKENQYVYIQPNHVLWNFLLYNGQQVPIDDRIASDDVYYYREYVKYKVSEIRGKFILINKSDGIFVHPDYVNSNLPELQLTPQSYPVACFNSFVSNKQDLQNIGNYLPLLYNIILTTEGNVDDDTLYVTEISYSRASYQALIASRGEVKGVLLGDCLFSLSLHEYPGGREDILIYNPGIYGNHSFTITFASQQLPAQGWYGRFISMSPIDIFRPQWNQNIGQVNTTNYKQGNTRRLTSALCFSNPLIQGSQVNGLNKFNSLDFRQAPAENGPITALVTTNATQREPGVLLSIGTFGISSFYYDAIQLTNVDGSSNVTTTDAFLASQRPLLGQFGTSRPMSITKTPLSTVYWWSDVVNDMIRYSNAGLERLGLTYSFSNYLRKEYNDNEMITSWYDQVTDEILLMGKGRNAATFNERYKTFQGARDYISTNGITPERSMGIATKIYFILEGKIWLTDVNSMTAQNNFVFGRYRNPNLTIVTNESPATVKRWNQIKVFGSKPLFTTLSTTGFQNLTNDALTSLIDAGYWIERKGDWEAAIRRASNTPGGVMSGKLMESRILYSNFAFDAQTFSKLNFLEIKSNSSIVQ